MLNANAGDRAYAARIQELRPAPLPVPTPRPSLVPAPGSAPALAADAILLGTSETGQQLGLSLPKLLEGRLLIQGISGAGKSWTLRRLLEQSATMIQQIIIDPEGEFRSLAGELGYLYVDGGKLDINAFHALGWRLRSSRVSAVIDISDLDRETQMKAITFFLTAMIECGQEHWHTAMVAIDEVHLLAPYGAQDDVAPAIRKASVSAITHLMSRGRKRGLVGVIATQRLVRLAKSVASEAQNYLIGMNTLDLDIKRAAETIGWDGRRASDRLPLLEAGSFVAVGPAFTTSPVVAKIGPVTSRHIGATPTIAAPVATTDEAARGVIDLEGLMRESAEGHSDDPRLVTGQRAVRAFVRDPGFVAASAVYRALKQLLPNGAMVGDLSAHLGFDSGDVATAVALLESHGIVELEQMNGVTAARIAYEFAKWKV
jgi:DNA helicase HerA-like ATPase